MPGRSNLLRRSPRDLPCWSHRALRNTPRRRTVRVAAVPASEPPEHSVTSYGAGELGEVHVRNREIGLDGCGFAGNAPEAAAEELAEFLILLLGVQIDEDDGKLTASPHLPVPTGRRQA